MYKHFLFKENSEQLRVIEGLFESLGTKKKAFVDLNQSIIQVIYKKDRKFCIEYIIYMPSETTVLLATSSNAFKENRHGFY